MTMCCFNVQINDAAVSEDSDSEFALSEADVDVDDDVSVDEEMEFVFVQDDDSPEGATKPRRRTTKKRRRRGGKLQPPVIDVLITRPTPSELIEDVSPNLFYSFSCFHRTTPHHTLRAPTPVKPRSKRSVEYLRQSIFGGTLK